MKKTAAFLFSTLLLLSMTMSSCYWRPFNSGGLRVDVSGIAARVGNPSDVIRVFLIADGLLFSTGGGVPFTAEVPASGDSQEQKINISGLPVGPKYRVMVGVGLVNGEVFQPDSYGDSGEFLINPNADTSVTVTLNSVPLLASYSPDLLGKPLKGLVDDFSSIFTAEEKQAYYTYFDRLLSTWSFEADLTLSGYSIRGLSKSSLYRNTALDTNKGILPFFRGTGWTFETAFSQGEGGSVDIAQSASFGVPGTDIDYAVFFRRQNGLGGTYVLNQDYSVPSAWKWVNVDLSGVRDLIVSQHNAYYAAGGAVFALPPAFLSDVLSGNPPNLEAHRIDLPSPAPVLSLGFRPDPLGLPGGTLTLGTSDGVYQAALDELVSAQLAPGPTHIAETAGDIIERIAISSYNSRAEAYLSRYYLYIRNWNGSNYYVDKTPFFAVVPGRATGLAWDSNGTLFISGTEGLSAVYVGYSAC